MGTTGKTVLSALAIATAAVLFSPAPAQAALGSTAAVCVPGTPNCTTLTAHVGSSPVSIFKNNIVWVGGTQSEAFWNSPDTVEVWTFTPLNAILWAQPVIPGLWTWFEGKSSQGCFLGITTALGGPYSTSGTYTHAYNHGGCNPS